MCSVIFGGCGFVVVAAYLLFRRFVHGGGKTKIDHWKMNAPVVGKAMRLKFVWAVARTLATL